MHAPNTSALERRFPGFSERLVGPAIDPQPEDAAQAPSRNAEGAQAVSTLVTAQMQFVALAPAGIFAIAAASDVVWSSEVKIAAGMMVSAAVLSFYAGIRVLRAIAGLITRSRTPLTSNQHIKDWSKAQLDFTTTTFVLVGVTVLLMFIQRS